MSRQKLCAKLLSLVLTFSLLVTLFTACSSGQTAGQAGTTAEKKDSTEAVTSAAKTSDQSATSSQAKLQGDINVLTYEYNAEKKDNPTTCLDRSVENLHKNFPGIKVNFISVPYNEYENKVRVTLSSGAGADVIYLDTPNLASYAENGALKPLDSYWDPNDFSDLVDASQQAMKYKGKIYAAPLNEANLAIFYNKDLTDKAGITPPKTVENAWTWEQYYEAAKKLTQKDASGKVSVYGCNPDMGTPTDANEGTTFGLISWIWQGGGEVISADGSKASGVFDSQQNIDTLKFFQKFYTEKLAPVQAIPNGFETGKIAMIFVGPWEFGNLKTNYPQFHVGTTPLPKNAKAASPTGSWDMAITSISKNPDAAWEFVKQATSKADLKYRNELTGDIPARKSILKDSSVFNTDLYAPFNSQLMNGARPRPLSPVYPKISDALSKAFNDVAFGKDPAETVKKYAEIMQKAIDGK